MNSPVSHVRPVNSRLIETLITLTIIVNFLVACSTFPPNREDPIYEIAFYELAMDNRLLVDPIKENYAFWHYGLDVGGSGRICAPEESLSCLVLDDFWTFAIPSEYEIAPFPGARWSFQEWHFQIVEVVSVPGPNKKTQDLIVISIGPKGISYQFRYNKCDGVLAVLEMVSGIDGAADNLREIADSDFKYALTNPRLYNRHDRCWNHSKGN